MDATDLYGHSMIQHLPYDEIEIWHGQADLYINKLDEFIKLQIVVILVISLKLI